MVMPSLDVLARWVLQSGFTRKNFLQLVFILAALDSLQAGDSFVVPVAGGVRCHVFYRLLKEREVVSGCHGWARGSVPGGNQTPCVTPSTLRTVRVQLSKCSAVPPVQRGGLPMIFAICAAVKKPRWSKGVGRGAATAM